MVNQLVLIGHLEKDLELTNINKKKYYILSLIVRRPFKNLDGEYDYDHLSIYYWDEIVKHIIKRLHKDKLVAVKGRVEIVNNKIFLIGEKVTIVPNY